MSDGLSSPYAMPVGVISMPLSLRAETLPLLPGVKPLDSMRWPVAMISARSAISEAGLRCGFAALPLTPAPETA